MIFQSSTIIYDLKSMLKKASLLLYPSLLTQYTFNSANDFNGTFMTCEIYCCKKLVH